MLKTDYRREITRLDRAFDKKLTEPKVKALWDVIGTYEYDHFKEGITFLINNSTFPPTNKEIITATRTAWEHDWDSKKQIEAEKAQEFFEGNTATSDYARLSFKAIDAARISNTITGKTHLMYELEKQFPGKGWKENADALTRQLQAMGMAA